MSETEKRELTVLDVIEDIPRQGPQCNEREALISIAISMKRIADVVCGNDRSSSFLDGLGMVLEKATNDHATRMWETRNAGR